MTKRNSDGPVEALGIEVPKRSELAALEPVLESLHDLAQRRDCLRLLAERANAEADQLDKMLSTTMASHERALRSLAESIRQDRAGGAR